MTKKTTAQRLGAGSMATAAGYVTKARPGPAAATAPTGTPVRSEANPRTENTTKPAQMLVALFITGIRIDVLQITLCYELAFEHDFVCWDFRKICIGNLHLA